MMTVSRHSFPALIAAVVVLLTFTNVKPAYADLGMWMSLATGKYEEVEQILNKAIQDPSGQTVNNLAPLCIARYKLKKYTSIFKCLELLEQQIADGNTSVSGFLIPESGVTPIPGWLSAGVYLELGEYAKAIEVGERALQLINYKDGTWGPFPPKGYQIEILPILATAAALSGDVTTARQYQTSLSQLDVSDTQAQKYENLQNIGLAQIAMALGEYDNALKYLEKELHGWVRGLADMVAGGGSTGTIYDLPKWLMIGKAYRETGQLEKSKRALDQLINHARLPDQGDIHWLALFERGRVAEMENDPDAAIEYFLRAIDVIEKQRATLSSEAGKIGFAGNKQDVYERLVTDLILQTQADNAFGIVERSRARALVELLAGKLSLLEIFDDSTDTHQTEPLAKARLALPQLAQLLPRDEILIEYYITHDDLIIFTFQQGKLKVTTSPLNNLAASISRFRRAIESRNSTASSALAKKLYQQLISPIGNIQGENLTIVPHGPLHYLPFGALLDPQNKPLLSKWSYRVLPAASLLNLLVNHPDNGKLLIFGNPDLNDAKMDLPGAQKEAEAIGKLLQSTSLLRKAATEAAAKNKSGQFSRLHFATHGEFNADNALDSALLMAAGDQQDGRLTVAEIYDLKLKANLITLSACETGLGKIYTGDDVVGLTRGFLYAGASSIVSSLWQVDDASTALLMTTFYRNLKTMNKRAALTNAQRTVMKKYNSPFYWAAFQLTGMVQ